MTALALSAGALVALCLAFGLIFLFARRIDNYGIVDIAWSYAFAALAVGYSLLGGGLAIRRGAIATMAALWSARLGTHLLVRIARKHPVEDGRYQQLRKDWGGRFGLKMAGFFQLQALSVVLLGIPFLAACTDRTPGIRPLEWCACGLWALAILGETLADSQLSRFKGDRSNTGKVCDVGLWRYSRHPNYFFEWVIWVSYFLFGCSSPLGWIGILSPACILFLLLRVTGIPATEEQSIRSKGAAYLDYQRRTSAFVPLPRRNPSP